MSSRAEEATEGLVGLCRACAGAPHERLFPIGAYAVHECQSCGLVFLNPQPPDEVLANVYSAGDSLESGAGELEEKLSTIKRRAARLHLAAIARYGGPERGRVLDVGCGRGEFLLEAAARGFEVWGVDVSPAAVQIANARLGREAVRCSTIAEAGFPSGHFDVGVCINVLEHVRDPVGHLSELRRVIKRNGVLLLATPTLDSWLARLIKSRWFEFKTEHLYYFSTETLHNILARGGFEALEMSPARKILTLEYLYYRFRQYPVRGWSTLVAGAWRMAPRAIRNRQFALAMGNTAVLGRPGVEHARPVVSVIMPVYNEQRTVATVVETLIAKKLDGIEKEIIIVEGNSSDGSREKLLRYKEVAGVQLVLLDRNRGKGYAVREGLRRATGDVVLIQDADLEYDIEDYERLIEPVLTHRHAVVLGSRHSGSRDIHTFKNEVLLKLLFNFGHVFLTGLFNLLYRQRLKDPWTMYKVFRRECVYQLKFECNRFDFDVELLAKLARKGFSPIEVPIRYRSRSFRDGKKVKVMTDPWTWIWACLKYRLVSPYAKRCGR